MSHHILLFLCIAPWMISLYFNYQGLHCFLVTLCQENMDNKKKQTKQLRWWGDLKRCTFVSNLPSDDFFWNFQFKTEKTLSESKNTFEGFGALFSEEFILIMYLPNKSLTSSLMLWKKTFFLTNIITDKIPTHDNLLSPFKI